MAQKQRGDGQGEETSVEFIGKMEIFSESLSREITQSGVGHTHTHVHIHTHAQDYSEISGCKDMFDN